MIPSVEKINAALHVHATRARFQCRRMSFDVRETKHAYHLILADRKTSASDTPGSPLLKSPTYSSDESSST